MNNDEDKILKQLAELIGVQRQDMLQYACYRLGNIDDAEDVVQDLYVKIQSRVLRGDSPAINNLRSYLFQTLSNLCASRQRLWHKDNVVRIDDGFDCADSLPDDFEQNYRRIAFLLRSIPEEQAEVIRLRVYGDNSFQEIADILAIPLPTVKSRFLYGLEKIRKDIMKKQR